MRVGFLGLGQMGFPMAANLARAGLSVRVYNRTGGHAEKLVGACPDLDVEARPTPAEAVAGADVVVTMLADPGALEAVYSGADGVLSALTPGLLAIEMSTVGPQAVLDLGARVVGAGGAIVDAPVSGSVAFAASGSLTIMVGGTRRGRRPGHADSRCARIHRLADRCLGHGGVDEARRQHGDLRPQSGAVRSTRSRRTGGDRPPRRLRGDRQQCRGRPLRPLPARAPSSIPRALRRRCGSTSPPRTST